MSLLERIRSILNREEPSFQWQDGSPLPRDAQLSIAALLLEVANGDTDLSSAEYKQLSAALRKELGLSGSETKDLLEDADQLRFSQQAVTPFVETLRRTLTLEQRAEFLDIVWRIVKADKKVEEFETCFANWLASSLGVSA